MRVKKSIHSASSIKAATTAGTTFYEVTLEDIQSAFNEDDANVWIGKMFELDGWDAIDFETALYGSQIIDDVLYICVTDGQDIKIKGEYVDPEAALEYYQLNHLSEYIKEGTSDIIKKYITEYEVVTPDFNKLAELLLKDGHLFTDIVKDAQEFDSF